MPNFYEIRKSQKERVKDILLKNKTITRNQAISMGITRLGSIIDALKNEGYVIEGFWIGENQEDYGYRLKSVTSLNKIVTNIEYIVTDFSNLYELEEWIAKKANELKEKGENIVLINVFEPILDVLSRMFDLPKRSIIILSGEKTAFINKVSFNIMNVFFHVKNMFYQEGKKTYLKNRVERIIQKTKNKYADTKVNIIIYGFNKKDKDDIELFKELKKKYK